MNELALKCVQAQQLRKTLRVVLADTVNDVQAAVLSMLLAEVAKRLALPDKISLMHQITVDVFGPEPVESQLERYIQELKDGKKPEEKAAPPSSGIV